MADWRDEAACKGHTPRMFLTAFESLAIRTCQGCPVRSACQAEGAGEDWGVWGGLRPEERRRVARKRKDAA